MGVRGSCFRVNVVRPVEVLIFVVVDAVGGSMRRWSRCEDRCVRRCSRRRRRVDALSVLVREAVGARQSTRRSVSTAALRLRRLMDRRRLGAAVALAFDGSEEVSLLLFVLLQSMQGWMRLLQSMRGSMRLYDGSEEAVALLVVGCRLVLLLSPSGEGRLISSNDRIRAD
jgi:hypothetical protein